MYIPLPFGGRASGLLCVLLVVMGGKAMFGQADEEYVSIRVEGESARESVTVRLERDDEVLGRKKTDSEGIVRFYDLPQGEYVVAVPKVGFSETVKIEDIPRREVRETVTVSQLISSGSGGGTSGNVAGREMDSGSFYSADLERILIYGVLVILVIVAGILGYVAVVEMETDVPDLGLTSGRGSVSSWAPSLERFFSGARQSAAEEDANASSTPTATESEDVRSAQTANPSASTEGQSRESSQSPSGRRLATEKYTMQERIGSGGMSTVWLAQDSDGRDVALKVMSENMLGDDELIRKFIQEGKALERISSTHPGAPVVEIYDYGRLGEKQQPYLALEYLDGDSLGKLINPDTPLSVERTLPVVKQIAIALSAAHANDVYHRDVKPENVIITDRASVMKVMLIDFGVARHNYMSYVTMDGSLLGTPPYMSPEQGTDKKVDARSDIYSLGILSYALLVGEPPFIDKNPLTVLQMHQEDSVPPFPDSVPTDVAELIRRMLEKDPENRPQKMWEVVGHIDQLMAR